MSPRLDHGVCSVSFEPLLLLIYAEEHETVLNMPSISLRYLQLDWLAIMNPH